MDAAATLDSVPRRRIVKPDPARPVQPSLFGAEMQPKIIPFDKLQRSSPVAAQVTPGVADVAAAIPIAASRLSSARQSSKPRKNHPVDDTQATLDFLPAAKAAPRTLKTSAEAVIFCDAVAASPVHRATSAAIDLGLISIGYACFVCLFRMVARPAPLDRMTLVLLGAMLAITALFYGLLFAISGTVTPGMRWTHLRLINFDGFPLDARSRALRFAGSWISVLSGGIGLLWALLDEENLTWHDHMSRSFPTLRESNSIVVRPGQQRQG